MAAERARRTPPPFGPFQRIAGLIVTAVIVGGGCRVGPAFRTPPAPPLGDEFTRDETSAPADDPTLAYWWTNFNDPLLNDLIAEACRENLDLKEAFWRVQEARGKLGVVRGDWFPQLDSTSGYGYRRNSLNAGEFVPAGAGGSYDLYSMGFDSRWEIDLFGKIASNVEAATADWEASIDDASAVRVTVLADVAGAYVRRRVLQAQLRVARGNLESQRQTLELVRVRRASGLAGPLDEAQAESNVHLTAAAIPAIEEQLAIESHRLDVLRGDAPSKATPWRLGEAAIPQPAVGLAAGAPAELLRRRPDVRAAERRVAAANARIGAAVAERYPELSIKGVISVDSRDVTTWFSVNSLAHNVGPAVRWNLLSFGAVQSAIQTRRTQLELAVVDYQKTVLAAVEEVENGLVAYHREQERAVRLSRAAAATRRAVEASRQRYEKGLLAFQSVLDSERQLLLVEAQAAESQGAVVLHLIRVYKALGGGWEAIGCATAAAETTAPVEAWEVLPAPAELPAGAPTDDGVFRLPQPESVDSAAW